MPARTQRKNPQVKTYMLAARKAAQAGDYDKVIKLLQKASDKRSKTKNPIELASVMNGALSGAAFSLAKAALNPSDKTYAKMYFDAVALGDFEKAEKIADRQWKKAGGTVRMSARKRAEIIQPGWAERQRRAAKNPAGDASQEFADFHGREPKELLDLQEKLMKSGHYWAVGDNPELWLRPVKGDPNKWGEPDIWFDPEDGVKLAANKAGTQLFFVGGQKQLSLDELKQAGHDTSKRFITLGGAHGISYETEKIFDDYEHKSYAHQLGEETGVVPTAIYDRETGRILLAGGEYHIPGVDTNLGASPGIVN